MLTLAPRRLKVSTQCGKRAMRTQCVQAPVEDDGSHHIFPFVSISMYYPRRLLHRFRYISSATFSPVNRQEEDGTNTSVGDGSRRSYMAKNMWIGDLIAVFAHPSQERA